MKADRTLRHTTQHTAAHRCTPRVLPAPGRPASPVLQSCSANSMASPTSMQPAAWSAQELQNYALTTSIESSYSTKYSEYNPTPGTGRTGFLPVPPNNFPFYNTQEVYTPIIQQDGGQLSEWQPMYAPSREQAEADRAAAYAAGVPHGYVPAGDKYKDLPTIELRVVSNLHTEEEYGPYDEGEGRHRGGPFTIRVSPTMRIEELRKVIYEKGGILPALQKLSYAGKRLADSQRTLQQYGVAYWHAKFPHWPLKISKY